MAHETIHIGLYVIFGIIMLPVYVMILGWFLGKPRDFRSIALTFGYMLAFIGALVAGLFVIGTSISLLTPY
ncbi:putative membrane protein [Halalkaliarchaeum sp. AArc-CO]|uniref:hypothetical protein n=1 Tax=unclassified Halalkaliarchaeum TaxID=2678344 RepID=UPI00217DE1A2|nr:MULTISPECIES: hypothetical protein [unclassified Halalkaliarchaeum]MDR5671558.1 hypothetical protein [Halalkaliarchaeum sp. AArc-GB]UWG51058.1 putative membrane protein [Halalkaliarchaeum sp. AArc-CO]